MPLIQPSYSLKPSQIRVSDADANPTLDIMAPIFKVLDFAAKAVFVKGRMNEPAVKINAKKKIPNKNNKFLILINTLLAFMIFLRFGLFKASSDFCWKELIGKIGEFNDP